MTPASDSGRDGAWDKLAAAALILPFSLLGVALFGFAVTPMNLMWQFVAGTFAMLVALLVLRHKSRRISLFLMALSLAFSTRYLYWRFTETLPIGEGHNLFDLVLASGLLVAETYAFVILLLGYFQVLWPLSRRPVRLPDDAADWPTVDLFIPTYNEALGVVRPTVLAAMEIDWPQDKLRVYLLDDGRRPEFEAFAREAGAFYMTRPDNRHAKAGNINHAMQQTDGEYIAIFDCDHIPTRSFLQMTMGTLVANPRIALVQTPHHFFSPDPFERNLNTFRKVPNEGELFYGLVQAGNDLWDASFFCGSCAVIRRTALEEVGGIAVETVTEDAHTALRLHQRGWQSAYIGIPQAAGLATESLSAHIGQRIRWARGMAQIFRLDNPLIAHGLKLGQRLCYSNAMMHFFYGIPRLIFLTSPLAFLLFGAEIIRAEALMILAYAFPHLVLAVMANSRLQGAFRHSWWAEVYETVLATFIILPTTLALINPKLGKFNVTAKGGMVDRDYFDGDIAKPYYLLYLLNMAGVIAGVLRLIFADDPKVGTVLLNLGWATYNLIILGAALSVAGEKRQVRSAVRVQDELKVQLRRAGDAKVMPTMTIDLSTAGIAIRAIPGEWFEPGQAVEVALESPGRPMWLPASIRRTTADLVAMEFAALTLDEESSLTQSLFGRADAWVDWRDQNVRDRPLNSLANIFRISLSGSRKFWEWVVKQLLLKRGSGARERTASFALALAAGAFAASSVLAPQPAAAQDANPASAAVIDAPQLQLPVRALPPVLTTDRVAGETRRVLSFEELGVQYPMRMSTILGQSSVGLGLRRDQVVTKAQLRLRYAHSPSLIETLSHVTTLINDEVVSTFELRRDDAPGAERIIDINPSLFQEFNRIRFDVPMHYTLECEDPTHTSLWSIISDQSQLELTLAALPLPADLAMLPRPFFDPNDPRRLTLPVSFAGQPDRDTMSAAAVAASWFGAQADYRGAEFPVRIGSLPIGHGLVLRSGRDFADDNLGPMPDRPRIRVVVHPADPGSRLLLLEAPDAAGLLQAAQALALGAFNLDGAVAEVRSVELPPPPARGTAPRWVNPDLKARLGELSIGETSVRGMNPGPMNFDFRLPPDVYFFEEDGAKVDVRYRYSPGVAPDSSMTTLTNEAFIGSVLLPRAGQALGAEDEQVSDQTYIEVPAHRLASRNRLTLQYQFLRRSNEPCEHFLPQSIGGSIDPDSTISFTRHGRYARWPDLGRFRDGGLPFSLTSDLGQTALLLPEQPDEDALSAALTLAGHLGQTTGAPGLRVAVDGIGAAETYADRDLILVGRESELDLPVIWAEDLPLIVSTDGAQLRPMSTGAGFRAWVAQRDLAGGGSELGLILGARSPWSDRSAVWLTAGSDIALAEVARVLIDPERRQFVEGDVSLIRADGVSGYLLGDQWGIGRLSLYIALREWLGQRPYLMAPVAILFAILAVLLLYYLLRRRAAARLKPARPS
ncbi:UDP-forming cellulose synthase catalytic subunit [Panacagrimonas sp.]|uniref:UDP-forming cellulose synthase catalytic subunit n=1 Tax=Panacagrimonas sp. TaxID=2480088 RepID=UPI003B52CAC5